MKARNINTKHLSKTSEGYIGYTSKLKPSLFYGNPKLENDLWIQDYESNTMTHWVLSSITTFEGVPAWEYVPREKTLKKHPEVEGLTVTIVFDVIQDTKFARKKRSL